MRRRSKSDVYVKRGYTLTEDLAHKLRVSAAVQGMTASDLLIRVLERHFAPAQHVDEAERRPVPSIVYRPDTDMIQ